MTRGKTHNKSPRRINHKATKSKTNTGTTALERSVEQTTGGFKALLQLANFTLGPDATLNTEIHKNLVRIKAPKPEQLLDRPRAMKNCDVLYHFHNALNLDVFLIWKFFFFNLFSVVAFQCQSICRQIGQCCTRPNNK